MDAWRFGGFRNLILLIKKMHNMLLCLLGQMGVKEMSPTDLRKFMAGKTVSVTPYINDHEEGIEGRSSVKDFETFLH
jgi:zinc protease